MTLPAAASAGILALLVLMLSARHAVDGVGALLKQHGLSSTFGGLTVFSLLTSLPELMAHLMASLGILSGGLDPHIASAIVLGANIGSDVVQQTLVLGLVVLLVDGFTFSRRFLLTAYLPMIGTTLMTLVLAWDGLLSRGDGVVLLTAFVLYNAALYRDERSHPVETPVPTEPPRRLVLVLWFALILGSAHILLVSTEQVVRLTGLGGSMVGVVTMGVASAAPEMATALSAVRRGEVGLSLGTLIGSNITNPLVAIGGGALLSTYQVPRPLVYWDLPMETATAALLLVYLMAKPDRGRLGRGGGLWLVALYGIYLAGRVALFPDDVPI